MARDPASDFATFLAAQSIGLTIGTNLFPGPVKVQGPGIPYNSVFVMGRAGRMPDRTMGQTFEVRSPIVHIRLRNREYSAGVTLSGSIQEAILDTRIANYLDVDPLQSAGEMVQDGEGVMYWGLSYIARYQQDATP